MKKYNRGKDWVFDYIYDKSKPYKKPYTTRLEGLCLCDECCSEYLHILKTRDVFNNRVYNRKKDWFGYVYQEEILKGKYNVGLFSISYTTRNLERF